MTQKSKKNKNGFHLIYDFSLILYTISNIWLIINIFKLEGIENILRYLFIFLLIIINLFLILIRKRKKKKKKLLFISLILLFFTLIFSFISYNADKVLSILNSFNKDEISYSSSIVTLTNSNIDNIKDLGNKKIGIINDTSSYEGYLIPKLIISENKIDNKNLIEYSDYVSMLNDLYNEKIDALFLPTNYVIMFNTIEKFSKISEETKTIITKSKSYENKIIGSSNKKLDKPFTILLMGVDSEVDGLSNNTAFNGDALILATFNPNTLNATLLSIPRDTYVPIACFKNQYENKITHAAWQGESCMIDTIENFTKIDIDYYVKINFKGVVDLVNALDGIEVDVPFNFCEQDSKRRFGKNMIYVDKGLQTINGEEALALARHRKNYSECGSKYSNNNINDIVRGTNQQLVIKGILNKLRSINSLNDIYDILNAIEKNMDTNISTSSILSLYSVFKNVIANSSLTSNIISMQRLYLSGYDQYIYDENMKMTLYNYIYYRGSLNDIVEAMKINLELIEPELIKEFTYSANKEYEEELIGKGNYKIVDYITTLPNFIGKTKSEVDSFSLKNNITVNYVYEETNDYTNGTIIKQSYPYGYRVKNIKDNLIITIAKTKEIINHNNINTYYDCTLEDNNDKKECQFSNYIGKDIKEFKDWYKNLSKYNINIPTPTYIIIDEDNSDYNEENKGIIIKQSIKPTTLLSKIEDITITYIKEE